jgi:hypothetical protein
MEGKNSHPVAEQGPLPGKRVALRAKTQTLSVRMGIVLFSYGTAGLLAWVAGSVADRRCTRFPADGKRMMVA